MTHEHARSIPWNRPQHTAPKRRRNEPQPVLDDVAEAYPPHPGRRMTEEEFLAWAKEKTRAEWVDGEVIIMSPVSNEHDDIYGFLYSLLRGYADTHDLGRICGSEFIIRLPKPKARRQPDIFFVAKSRATGFTKTFFDGAPDLIIEIVSPESTTRDYLDKLKTYQASGVREYWIIDPLSARLEANELVKGRYKSIEPRQGAVHSKVLKGFYLKPEWCWQRPLPKFLDILRELIRK